MPLEAHGHVVTSSSPHAIEMASDLNARDRPERIDVALCCLSRSGVRQHAFLYGMCCQCRKKRPLQQKSVHDKGDGLAGLGWSVATKRIGDHCGRRSKRSHVAGQQCPSRVKG
jgi:hypothetical protein